MSRGLYRGIYSSLVDDPEFQTLTPNAKLVFYTARLCQQAGAAAIFRYYHELLVKQTGLSARHVELALLELERELWIIREGVILWIRNGLRHDPSMRLSDPKHRKAVERVLMGLPKLNIVLSFCDYYKIPRAFDGVTKISPPSPSPSPSPKTDTESDLTALSGSPPDRPSPKNGFSPESNDVLAWLNAKAAKNFRPVAANLALIDARLKDGITAAQLRAIVSRKVREWTGTDQAKYLRPETLFNRTKAEQYVGELPKVEVGHGD